MQGLPALKGQLQPHRALGYPPLAELPGEAGPGGMLAPLSCSEYGT